MEIPPLSDDTPETSDSRFFFPLPFEGVPLLAGAGGPGSSGHYHVLCLSVAVRMIWYELVHMTYKDTADASPMTPKLLGVVKAFNSSTSKHKLLLIDDANDIPGKFLSAINQYSVSSQLLSDQSSVEGILVQCSGGMLCRVCTQISHLFAGSSTLEMLLFQSEDIDFCLSDEKATALSEGRVQTKCLRSLGLRENFMKTQFADVLTSAFTGCVQNTSLELIELPANLERLGMALDRVLRTVSDTSRVVVLSFFVDASETLRFPVEEEQKLLSCWRKWLCANDGALKLKIRLQLQSFCAGCPMNSWMDPVNQSTWLFLDPNTAGSDFDVEGFFLLCRSIQSTDTVEFIQLDMSYAVPDSFWI
ncbi:hypothetical protein R1sor_007896 [Riccia sorocarpa]|uniref:Uncharacterized protein n=1 Tax=Riccia sorocarpa TaxID=122646 RepID=A0ABD3HRT4_9MARC